MSSHFSRYYLAAARTDADVVSRWDALEACLMCLDNLTTVAEDGLGHDRVGRAVRAELDLGGRLSRGPDASAAKADFCAAFVVLLRFRLLHELRQFDRERVGEKARGVRVPRRRPFTEERIVQIVRSVRSRLPWPPVPRRVDGLR